MIWAAAGSAIAIMAAMDMAVAAGGHRLTDPVLLGGQRNATMTAHASANSRNTIVNTIQ